MGSSNHKRIEESELLTSVEDFHIDFRYKGIYARALIAHSYVQDAHIINDEHRINSNAEDFEVGYQIGSHLLGFYIEFGYDILHATDATKHNLILFTRYERIEKELVAAKGYVKLPHNQEDIITFGIVYKPIFQISIKADYEMHISKRVDDRIYLHQVRHIQDTFNINIGFSF